MIVATHLLESMLASPMPSRAEVTDVANAVCQQVDAVMLSGETATGKHLVRCVTVLNRIALRIEKEPGFNFHADRQRGQSETNCPERLSSQRLAGFPRNRRHHQTWHSRTPG